MTIRSYTFNGGTAGAAVATGSPLAGGDTAWTAVQVPTGGSYTFDSDSLLGSLAGKIMIPSGANGYSRWAEPAHFAGAKVGSFKLDVLPPSGEFYLMRNNAASTMVFSVSLLSTGKLRIRHTASDNVWTSTANVPIGQWFTVDTAYTISGASSKVRARLFSTSATLIEDSGEITYDLGSAGIDATFFGCYGNASTAVVIRPDQIKSNDASATLFGPPLQPLSNPVVTLGAVDSQAGTATVSWPAVAGATNYTAHKASGATPEQGDFTQVATGVTSPYTFTGLGAGTWALGIRAEL